MCFRMKVRLIIRYSVALQTTIAGILALIFVANSGYADEGSSRSLLEINAPLTAPVGPPIAIVGARLIDGLGGPTINDSVVLVQGDRIVAAGPRENVPIPENAELVDAKGKSVMPGLIDAHFHSVMNNSALKRVLKNGVTTIRDPGHPFRFYQNLHFSEPPMPRVFLTGAHIDGFPPVWVQQAVVARTSEHVRRTVHEHVDNGGTGIKIYFNLPIDYYEPIVEAASERGVPVFAHLELVDADDAIRAEVDGLEHVTSFGTALADPVDAARFKESVRADFGNRRNARFELWANIEVDSERVRNILDLAVRQDVVMVPTLALYERREGDSAVRSFHVEGYRNMVRFVGMAHAAGMSIVIGSHTRVPHAEVGWAFQREMEVMVEAGMTPLEVITASTSANAKYFRIAERLGSIEAGKLADLLLIDGNPVEDISMMYNVDRVMVNGMWVDTDWEK